MGRTLRELRTLVAVGAVVVLVELRVVGVRGLGARAAQVADPGPAVAAPDHEPSLAAASRKFQNH